MHIKTAISILGLVIQWFPAPTLKAVTEIPFYYSDFSIVKQIEDPKLSQLSPLTFAPFPFLPMGSRPNSYAPGNCTWGAASMKPTVPESWGNANTWDDNARAAGITVSDQPIAGAVAETDRGYYGHVAVVDAVEPSGQAEITEMNYDNNGGIRTRLAAPGEFSYIYL